MHQPKPQNYTEPDDGAGSGAAWHNPPDASPPAPAETGRPGDIQSLRRQLQDYAKAEARPADAAAAAKAPARGVIGRRLGKVALGAICVALFGLIPLRTLMQNSSVEAVVNARIVTLRSPIAGEVVAPSRAVATSGIVSGGDTLLTIVNPRADRSRLEELQRQQFQIAGQKRATEAKLAAVRSAKASLDQQAEQFRTGRIEQLAARAAELESLIAAAGARREEAAAARNRAAGLARTGSVSQAEFARLQREAVIQAETETSIRHRLTALTVETAAARNGVYLGDSYNDRPSSVQRSDELRNRISDLEIDLAAHDAELARIETVLADEQARFRALSDVPMALPSTGRVWETAVSAGEQVRAGQDLVRIIDCGTLAVTANVTEAVYNRLSIGAPARFIPSDGGREIPGTVTNLTGMAGVPANLAIAPASLSKGAYHVAVSLAGTPSTNECGVGRTGRVVFGEAAGAP